jgi:hypothetical protein
MGLLQKEDIFMRLLTGILAVLVVGSLSQVCRAGGEDAPGFFNGKDLTGWEGLPGYWKVQDGALIGTSPPDGLKFNTFLCSKRKYGDFELSFQVRLKDGNGNSGVQIRSEILDPKRMAVKGPQCDIGDIYWGSLYGEEFGGMMQQAPKDLVTKVLKKGEFNDYYIKCVGKRVTIKLNGETTVDADFPKMPERGIIALQLHSGPAMEVTFRNIVFKDLDPRAK